MKKLVLLLVLVFAVAYAGQNDLLIAHCDPGSTSGVITNIGGYPGYDSADVVDCTTQTPSVATMENYGCVYTWSNYAYQDPTGMGNNMATYMDEGIGGVVSSCFAHYSSPGWGLGGRYANDADYCPVTMGGVYYSTTSLGSKDDTSPVIDGDAGFVSSISGIYYGEYCSKESPATWVADCANGYIHTAVNAAENAVGVNMYPGDYRYWSGDGWILYNNAIMYMMNGAVEDNDPPYVDGMDPDDGQSDVDLDSPVVFHCKDDISKVDTDTIDFTVQDSTLGVVRTISSSASVGVHATPARTLPGDLDVDDTDPADIVCTWTGDDPFYDDVTITCTVAAGLSDTRGNEMVDDFVWTFSTGIGAVDNTSWGAIKAEF
jgi:hypothetical protein